MMMQNLQQKAMVISCLMVAFIAQGTAANAGAGCGTEDASAELCPNMQSSSVETGEEYDFPVPEEDITNLLQHRAEISYHTGETETVSSLLRRLDEVFTSGDSDQSGCLEDAEVRALVSKFKPKFPGLEDVEWHPYDKQADSCFSKGEFVEFVKVNLARMHSSSGDYADKIAAVNAAIDTIQSPLKELRHPDPEKVNFPAQDSPPIMMQEEDGSDMDLALQRKCGRANSCTPGEISGCQLDPAKQYISGYDGKWITKECGAQCYWNIHCRYSDDKCENKADGWANC
eukprot:gnl/MRDRNA2_/MRDRNA2_104758_c0_seq1.p1 gnl/MRDRNA2_/MRDRNA2_104758_c0~~gnl/MRDRNA2_/MRDRNA2_104758_c0_seq1.p1  ORF type:complete len:286 (-),score=47.87 gnl/MRDRNA2_/MRDRNA2_104758_c0_seq1:100-957(-)